MKTPKTMKTMSRAPKALLLLTLAAGCTHSVHLVHVSDFEGVTVEQSKRIEARTEKFVILGFADDVDYVDQAYRRLQDECPKGRIQGITTQHSTSHGFLSYTQKILMQGLCIL